MTNTAVSQTKVPGPLTADHHASVLKSWSYTGFKVLKLCHVWNIDNFSLRSENTKEKLKSSIFSGKANDDELKWCIELYPKGVDEECRDYISLYLTIVSCRKPVQAKYRFSLLTARREEHREANSQDIRNRRFDHSTPRWGYRKFIARNFILNEANGLLPCDTLTILCEITAGVCQPNTTTQFQVPECSLSDDLASLFHSQKFGDVTLSVGDKEILVYKGVLAARSPVFAAMFQHEMEEQKQNRVTIRDVKDEVLKEMLTFIYTGESPNLHEMAEDLLAVADKYDLRRLKLMCEEALYAKISTENAADILILADLHSAERLKVQAVNFITIHAIDMIKTQVWKNIMIAKHPTLISEIFQALAGNK